MKTIITTLVAVAAIACAPAARAVTISLEAADNATVRPAGPRTGASGKAFYNVEGSANLANASFGVADFNLGAIMLPGPLVSVSLQMTESNAAFTLPGTMSFYVSDQTSVDIQPANTSLQYVAGSDGTASVDTDLSPLLLVGTGAFTTTGNVNTGQVDTYPLSFTGGALTSLMNALTNGTTLRIVMTPDTASTAATFAGNTNNTLAGPTLVFEAVPEPGSALLAVLAAAGLASWRRGRGRDVCAGA